MPREGKRSITVDEETFHFLQAAKGSQTWDNFLEESVVESSQHIPVKRDRSGPRSSYIVCKECSRTENTLRELNQRPCRDGISARE